MRTRGHAVFYGGFRPDLGVKIRSGWEASVLRWLNHLNIPWEYEPKRFEFPVKRGTKSYTPDIYLPSEDRWIEIKGALMGTDRTRLRRFKRHHPEEFAKLQVIVGTPKTPAALFFEELGVPVRAYFLELDKEFRDVISNWKD